MAQFTTRVVLHNADWKNYEALHGYMQSAGFKRTITSDDGTTYHLPDAEYDYSGTATKAQVLEKAKAAAARTGKTCSVLVTESSGRTWSGLTKV